MNQPRTSKGYIWISASLFVAFVIAGIVFFLFWAPWTVAMTTEEAARLYPGQVNPSWRAVKVDHGKVSEWSLGTRKQNPVGFGLCTALLFSAGIYCVGAACWVNERQKR